MNAELSLTLNLLLRGGVLMLLLLIAATLLRDRPHAVAARLGALFAIGTGAFVVDTLPAIAGHPMPWQLPLVALDSANMPVFWLFTRALLDDAFRPRARHAALWLAFAALGVLECFWLGPARAPAAAPLALLLTLAPAGFAALAVAQSLATWREDLVEGRRRLRMFIVAAAAAYSVGLAFAAVASGTHGKAVFASAGNAFGLAVLTLLIGWHLLRLGADGLFPEPKAPSLHALRAATATAAAPGPDDAAQTAPHPGPHGGSGESEAPGEAAARGPDPAQVAALERLMREERPYRDEQLNIAALARRMALPEYRLRRLVNQGLGHRNFSAFLNTYRIEDARAALGDPARASVTVLTIAMDAGFQSLGPFNRAFKAATGLTPTEFRRAALGPAGA